MYPNYNQPIQPNPNMPQPITAFVGEPTKDNFFMYFIVCLVVAIIGSFLDFVELKTEIYGFTASDSTNYISYTNDATGETRYKDGVFVLPLLIGAAILLYKKKFTVAQVLSVIAIIIVIADIATAGDNIEPMYKEYITITYGIGCYLVTLATAGCVIIAFMIAKKNKPLIPAMVSQNFNPAMNQQMNYTPQQNFNPNMPQPMNMQGQNFGQPMMPQNNMMNPQSMQQPMAQPPVQPPMMGQPPMGQPMPPQQSTNDNQQNPNGMR